MRKRLLLLTGSPGVGKTTLLLRVVEALRARGYSVGGMVSREVRSCGARVGFELLDLSSLKRGWLAHVNGKVGPSIGRYHVNLDDLEGLGVQAIVNAVDRCNIVAIDEVGPMELFSDKFKEAVAKAVESKKLVVSVVHWKSRNMLVEEMKGREDAEMYTVTCENRGSLHESIFRRAIGFLESQHTE